MNRNLAEMPLVSAPGRVKCAPRVNARTVELASNRLLERLLENKGKPIEIATTLGKLNCYPRDKGDGFTLIIEGVRYDSPKEARLLAENINVGITKIAEHFFQKGQNLDLAVNVGEVARGAQNFSEQIVTVLLR